MCSASCGKCTNVHLWHENRPKFQWLKTGVVHCFGKGIILPGRFAPVTTQTGKAGISLRTKHEACTWLKLINCLYITFLNCAAHKWEVCRLVPKPQLHQTHWKKRQPNRIPSGCRSIPKLSPLPRRAAANNKHLYIKYACTGVSAQPRLQPNSVWNMLDPFHTLLTQVNFFYARQHQRSVLFSQNIIN